MTAISVLTLARGRDAQLGWLMEGLARQTVPPAELIVAYMQDREGEGLSDPGVPVRPLFVPGDPMPLAAARNRAADAAAGDLLIFLDVDCVPHPRLVERYADAARRHDGLLLGEVRYLPAGALDGGIDPDRLDAIGRQHPTKPVLRDGEVRAEPDHGELWGLSFAIPATQWRAAGGMDEAYVGYGGEETDFAWRYAAIGGRMAWAGGARAWHQHHAIHVPPLHHLDAIVRNAMLFRARWGRWCMDYWLGQFRDRGLIRWDADRIEILRRPSAAEVADTCQPGDVLFS